MCSNSSRRALCNLSDLEAARDAVHAALPARCRLGPVSYDAGVVRADGLMGALLGDRPRAAPRTRQSTADGVTTSIAARA